ncbi:hypothetical protein [Desulfonema limicola]|nr:hypothetical protein [Desulfonema limicola]
MRGTQLWKHRTGAGARNDDMDNTCELLINVVSASKYQKEDSYRKS